MLQEQDWIEPIDEDVLGAYFEDSPPTVTETMVESAKYLGLLPLYLFRNIPPGARPGTTTLLEGPLLEKEAMYVSRSRFFGVAWDHWLRRNGNDRIGGGYFNEVNMFHQFALFYLQEVRAPLRHHLAVLLTLMELYHDNARTDWREMLPESKGAPGLHRGIITRVITRSDHVAGDFSGSFEFALQYLDQGTVDPEITDRDGGCFPDIGEIHRCIGQGDYTVELGGEDDERFVRFFLESGDMKRPLYKVLHHIRVTLFITRLLGAGTALTLFHAAVMHREGDRGFQILDAFRRPLYPVPPSKSSLHEVEVLFENLD